MPQPEHDHDVAAAGQMPQYGVDAAPTRPCVALPNFAHPAELSSTT